jgi:hypothetical protein
MSCAARVLPLLFSLLAAPLAHAERYAPHAPRGGFVTLRPGANAGAPGALELRDSDGAVQHTRVLPCRPSIAGAASGHVACATSDHEILIVFATSPSPTFDRTVRVPDATVRRVLGFAPGAAPRLLVLIRTPANEDLYRVLNADGSTHCDLVAWSPDGEAQHGAAFDDDGHVVTAYRDRHMVYRLPARACTERLTPSERTIGACSAPCEIMPGAVSWSARHGLLVALADRRTFGILTRRGIVLTNVPFADRDLDSAFVLGDAIGIIRRPFESGAPGTLEIVPMQRGAVRFSLPNVLAASAFR